MKSPHVLVAAVLFLLAVALYQLAVQPASKVLFKKRAELSDVAARQGVITVDLAGRDDLVHRIAELEKTAAANRAALFTPMLNSYAMRAKEFLDVFAREAGILRMEYEEGEVRALPVPKDRIPKARTARRSVRMGVQGDYAAIVSFLLRVEKELPLVTLAALDVAPLQDSLDVQSASLVFEWPVAGEQAK